MMKLSKETGNGFVITEHEVREKEGLRNVTIEILSDGIPINTEVYENITQEKKEWLAAKYLSMEMEVFCIESGDSLLEEEQIRYAKKISKLGIINGFKLILTREENNPELFKCEVQFLKSGEYSMASSCLHDLTPEKIENLKMKLNNIKKHQLDIKRQYRQLYLMEILEIIR